jgi:CheY-like chemotaxis protein
LDSIAPHLIISDLSMPEMDGFKMIKNLKNQSIATHAVIIAVTPSTRLATAYRNDSLRRSTTAGRTSG